MLKTFWWDCPYMFRSSCTTILRGLVSSTLWS